MIPNCFNWSSITFPWQCHMSTVNSGSFLYNFNVLTGKIRPNDTKLYIQTFGMTCNITEYTTNTRSLDQLVQFAIFG